MTRNRRYVRDEYDRKTFNQLKGLYKNGYLEDAFKLLNYIMENIEDEDYTSTDLKDDVEELSYLVNESNEILSRIR